jgi:hypothetical protein
MYFDDACGTFIRTSIFFISEDDVSLFGVCVCVCVRARGRAPVPSVLNIPKILRCGAYKRAVSCMKKPTQECCYFMFEFVCRGLLFQFPQVVDCYIG